MEGLDDCLFRAIQNVGDKTHLLGPVKDSTAPKKTQLLANQLKIKQKFPLYQTCTEHRNLHTQNSLVPDKTLFGLAGSYNSLPHVFDFHQLSHFTILTVHSYHVLSCFFFPTLEKLEKRIIKRMQVL